MPKKTSQFIAGQKVQSNDARDPIPGTVLAVKGRQVQVEHYGRGLSEGRLVRVWYPAGCWLAR